VDIDRLTQVLIDACCIQLIRVIETHQIYTRCSLIIAAVNMPISVPMLHGISECQHDECRCVGRFSPNTGTRYANELHYLWNYQAEVHQIFTRCGHIISAVNVHI